MKRRILILATLAVCVLLCSCGKSEAIIAAENAINAIGEVTLDSKDAIDKADIAVNALTDKDKEKFEHYDKLEEIKKQYKKLEEEKKKKTIRELKNKIQGYWVSGTSDFVGFENNNISIGIYPGCIDTGKIENIILDSENRLEISVRYPETTKGDEVIPSITKILNITINEKIISITYNDEKTYEYKYSGKTFEEAKKSLATARKNANKYEYLLVEERDYNRNGENYELLRVQKYKYDKSKKNKYVDELQIYIDSDIVSEVRKNGGMVINPAISRATYDYDSNGQVKYITYYGYNIYGEYTESITKFYYDDEGYISRSEDGDFVTLYKKGEIIETYYYTDASKNQTYTSSSSNNTNVRYEYDEYGNKVREETYKYGVLENYIEYIYEKK